MNKSIFTVKENRQLTPSIFRMVLTGDTSEITRPGQFVNILLPSFFLRRPISVCDASDTCLTIIYKTVGDGTRYMSTLAPGASLDLLCGLGNGYDTSPSGERPLLIGGGVGVPPLYMLCKKLAAEGKRPTVILGFNKAEEAFYIEEFRAVGAQVTVTTVDGSLGVLGFVTSAIGESDYTYVYTCGPEPMLKAVYDAVTTDGQFSFEERMGCGFGACMGCSCETKYAAKRICRDGPVLTREEIIW